MAPTPFERLYGALEDPARLERVYGAVLGHLFSKPLWENGPTTLRRVPWTGGPRARIEDRAAFALPGLYLWGAEQRPLYIGITRAALDRRFSRYIWQDRSQCKLAKRFEGELCEKGINGFPAEITSWYKRNYRSSTVRLAGAVRFAKEGIDNVWFALFPNHNVEQIRALERALVHRDQGVAVKWNRAHNVCALLNIQN